MASSWRRRGFFGLLGFLFLSRAAVAIASFAHRCLLVVLQSNLAHSRTSSRVPGSKHTAVLRDHGIEADCIDAWA